jgi:hypothetical protein
MCEKGVSMRRPASLAKKSQEIVTECIEQMSGLSWRERGATIDAALDRMCEVIDIRENSHVRDLSTGIFVATVLDRLDAPSMKDVEQAKLYAMSADLGHQLAACDWLLEQALELPAELRLPEERDLGQTVH